jgi:uridylate kinase
VDGVYTADPRKDPAAQRYDTVSFKEALSRDLKVMDATALSLCRENSIPVIVFDLHQPGNIRRVVTGETVGTFVGGDNHAAQ